MKQGNLFEASDIILPRSCAAKPPTTTHARNRKTSFIIFTNRPHVTPTLTRPFFIFPLQSPWEYPGLIQQHSLSRRFPAARCLYVRLHPLPRPKCKMERIFLHLTLLLSKVYDRNRHTIRRVVLVPGAEASPSFIRTGEDVVIR